MKDQELEVKFHIGDLGALEQRLQSLGAPCSQSRTYEVNLRFDTPDQALTRSLQVLRLRQDSKARLTYNGPGRDEGGVHLRREIEFVVSDLQHLNFEPLTYSRPVFDLACGMTTLKEKIIRAFPKERTVLKCRNYVQTFVKAENPKCKVSQFDDDDYLFINGRIIAPSNLKIFWKGNQMKKKFMFQKEWLLRRKIQERGLKIYL